MQTPRRGAGKADGARWRGISRPRPFRVEAWSPPGGSSARTSAARPGARILGAHAERLRSGSLLRQRTYDVGTTKEVGRIRGMHVRAARGMITGDKLAATKAEYVALVGRAATPATATVHRVTA